jgi:small subunit ribosomal protein S20
MPHTKSAKKRLRQTQKRRENNRAVKKAIKVQSKKFAAAVAGGAKDAMNAEFNLLAKRLDKAAAKRVLHPNTVARKKSQYALTLKEKLAAPPPAPKPE